VIKVTFEPSMAIHWLVFLRLRRTEIKTTYPAQKIVGVITKKDCAGVLSYFVHVIRRISCTFF
jgi:hypothetical protein